MPVCGGPTAYPGQTCTRYVADGGRCWQHGGYKPAAVEAPHEETPVLEISSDNGATAVFEEKPSLIVQAYRCPACGHLVEM